MNHRGVTDIGLLKTHRKTTEVLEFTKEILHQMTPFVHLHVVVDLIDAIRPSSFDKLRIAQDEWGE